MKSCIDALFQCRCQFYTDNFYLDRKVVVHDFTINGGKLSERIWCGEDALALMHQCQPSAFNNLWFFVLVGPIVHQLASTSRHTPVKVAAGTSSSVRLLGEMEVK